MPRSAHDPVVHLSDGGADVAADVVAAAAGDDQAWVRIHDRYAALIWRIARAYHLDRAEAADVCQTTWLRLAENLTRIREPSQVRWWLATTARREALRAQQRCRRIAPVEHDFDLDPDIHHAPAGEDLERSEESRAVMRAFNALASPCRVLLTVLIFEPLASYAEISARLEMPIGSIGPKRARCLERLRRASELDGGRPAA